MENIIIIGSSGLGKEIKCLIDDINAQTKQWNVLGFYDDAFINETEIIAGVKCLGTINDLVENISAPVSLAFAIANREHVSSILDKLKNVKDLISFPNLIHPNAQMGHGVTIGKGNIVTTQCVFTCDISLGNFNFFNTMCGIGHDVTIGDFNSFMPRVQISGNVVINDYNFFGMGSGILQNKKTGNYNTIMSYSLLTKSIGNNRKYFGIPAKRVDI